MDAKEAQIKSTLICSMTQRTFFCSRNAEFCDLFRNRDLFFRFRASFEAFLDAFRAALPTMGVVLP